MPKQINLDNTVSKFLDQLNHPLRKEIEQLRLTILNSDSKLTEIIKWNGPNYCFNGDDRITMRIQLPKLIQLIFHRGAKVKKQPKGKLINDDSGLLIWKENDRAIATFKNMEDIEIKRKDLTLIVKDWIRATS